MELMVKIPAQLKSVLLILSLVVLLLLGLNLVLGRYGRFWEKKEPGAPKTPTKISLACPTQSELCSQAKVLSEGNFSGLGFNLPQKTQVLAAFSGRLEESPQKPPGRLPTQPLLSLTADGYEGLYSFYGAVSVPLPAQVKAGEKIGEIGEGMFPAVAPLTGLNYVFLLKKDGQSQPISSSDFEK